MRAASVARAGLAGALFGLATCAAPDGRLTTGSIDQGTRRVIINYLIAHGMAESYVTSGRASVSGLLDLARSDHAALLAVRGQAIDPTWKTLTQAHGAVQTLIATTTTLDETRPGTPERHASLR